MASRGIKDRVAIIGMGCTKFGEHWDKGPEDLLVDAAYQAYESAGVEPNDVDAYWLGTMGSGISGLTLSEPLKIQYKPGPRVENMCATGSEALRQACYAVASGAFDMAMAIGVEKLKDSGYSGLVMSAPPNDGTEGSMTAPAAPRSRCWRPRTSRSTDSMPTRAKTCSRASRGRITRTARKIPRRNSRRKFRSKQSRTPPRLPTRWESWIARACRTDRRRRSSFARRTRTSTAKVPST